jgi:quinol monooxygenase YgiN
MSVHIQCEITPPDAERFIAAVQKFRPLFMAEGAVEDRLYRQESDPGIFLWAEEWDSRETMEAANDRYGPMFDEEAGLDGVTFRSTVLTRVEV